MTKHLSEIEGRNARENTAMLLRSIKDLVAEAAIKPLTQKPQPLPQRPAEPVGARIARRATIETAPRPVAPQTPSNLRTPPALSGPVDLTPRPAAPQKKSLFGRLFG